MEDIKKRKGFTLIELLVTIIIVALLFTITYSTVSNIFKSTENKDAEISEKFIINAAETYASEYNQNVGFKKFTNDDGKTSFCVLPKTLLNYGLYNQYENIQEYLEDGYYVYIEGNLGVYDYEFIKPDDVDEIKHKCVGQQIGSDFGNVEENKPNQVVKISENKGNTIVESGSSSSAEAGIPLFDVKYDFNINEITSTSNIKKYEYILDLDFSTNSTTSIVNKTLPVYVAFALDKSASMSYYSKHTNATAAIKTFSQNLVAAFEDNAHIALVEFGELVDIKREFKSEEITSFSVANGDWTNVSGGIDYASKLFNKLKNDLGETDYNDALKYTILLYDGLPNAYLKLSGKYDNTSTGYYDKLFQSNNVGYENCGNCLTYIQNSSKYLKDNMTSELITIGFQFSSSDNKLKEVSSKNSTLCSSSDYSGYCYYEAETENSTTTISDLLTSIQNSITTEVNKTEAKAAVVKIVFNEKIDEIIDNSENGSVCKKGRTDDNKNVLLECTLELDKKADMNYSYKLALIENALVCATGVNCTTRFNVFDSFTVTTKNKDNNEISTKSWNNSPTIVISQTSFYTVNDYKNESKY